MRLLKLQHKRSLYTHFLLLLMACIITPTAFSQYDYDSMVNAELGITDTISEKIENADSLLQNIVDENNFDDYDTSYSVEEDSKPIFLDNSVPQTYNAIPTGKLADSIAENYRLDKNYW